MTLRTCTLIFSCCFLALFHGVIVFLRFYPGYVNDAADGQRHKTSVSYTLRISTREIYNVDAYTNPLHTDSLPDPILKISFACSGLPAVYYAVNLFLYWRIQRLFRRSRRRVGMQKLQHQVFMAVMFQVSTVNVVHFAFSVRCSFWSPYCSSLCQLWICC